MRDEENDEEEEDMREPAPVSSSQPLSSGTMEDKGEEQEPEVSFECP